MTLREEESLEPKATRRRRRTTPIVTIVLFISISDLIPLD